MIFDKHGRAELVDIAARRPHLLEGLSDDDLSRLLTETGPAGAWANSVVRDRNGRLIDPQLQLTGGYAQCRRYADQRGSSSPRRLSVA